MDAKQFIEHIASKGLLETELLEKLRRQALQGENQWTPKQIIKFLVEQSYLTRFQAKTILTEVLADRPATPAPIDESLEFATDANGDPIDAKIADSLEGLEIEESADSDSVEVIDLEDANVVQTPAATNDVVDLGSFSDPVDPFATTITLPASQLGYAYPQSTPTGQLPTEKSAEVLTRESVGPGSLLDPEFDNTVWDSRLVIGSALVFSFLSIAAVVLYIVLANKSALKQWENAFDQYQGGSYQQALSAMESFAETFPADDKADDALSYAAMCKIHVQMIKKSDSSAQKIYEAILSGKEVPGFSAIAREELKTLLPNLADYYIGKAVVLPGVDDKRKQYELTKKTLEIFDMPGALGTERNKPAFKMRKTGIVERMSTVQRYIDRNETLELALVTITKHVHSKNTRDAFEEREELLKTYPELELDQRMRESVLAISRAEQDLVEVQPGVLNSNNDPIAVPAEHKVIVATRNGRNISGVQGYGVAVLAGGSVYGVELGTGQVQWRRHVGLQTSLYPVRVSEAGNADTIIVDEARYELVRVDTLTGEQKWRLPVGGPLTQPQVYNGMLYCNIHVKVAAATNDTDGVFVGVLLVVDMETGNVQRRIVFPMQTHVGPGFDDENGIIYQVGDHSNVYAISVDSGKCIGVYYQGHQRDQIVVPAVYAVGYVILLENGESRSRVVILKHDGEGTFTQGQENKTLSGLVTMALQVFARRLLVATNMGEIHIYEVDPNVLNPQGPLSDMTSIPGTYSDPIREYSSVGEGVLFMAGRRMVKYQVQAQLGKLQEEWIEENGDVYVGPIQRFGSIVVHVRQRQGTNAITVAGQMVDSRKPSWETDIGSSGSVMLLPSEQGLAAVTSQAGVFAVSTDADPQEVYSQGDIGDSKVGYSHSIQVQDQVVLQSLVGSDELLVFDDLAIGSQAKTVKLQGLTSAPNGAATAFNGQVLMPLADGKLAMFQLPQGTQDVVAFQPSLSAGQQVAWSSPALPSDDSDSFAILRDRKHLMRIALRPDPRVHLSKRASIEFAEPIYETIAALNRTVYVVRRAKNNDQLVGLGYQSLEELTSYNVQGRVVWGPYRVGSQVLLYTSSNLLYCFDENQRCRWATEQSNIKLLATGFVNRHTIQPVHRIGLLRFLQQRLFRWDELILTGGDGQIWRIQSVDGKTISITDLEHKITQIPVMYDRQLWVPLDNGEIRVIPLG
ncbi:MAG: PQQ-binding-like beta-propeller repeat protein [Planctomycetaceae bacterium]|nr:PQQ-binding-like beta-propeller repeat protein [Planctomycetaceae bacterium]